MSGRSWLPGLLAAVLLGAAPAKVALAQEPATAVDPGEEEAVRRYRAARELFDRGEQAAALAEIEASARLLPSPNSDLLRAHVLLALSRRPEAMAAYERAIQGSVERSRAGESRFQATLAEAGRSAAILRAALAEITVFVSGAPAGAVVTIDGAPAKLSPESGPSNLGARGWHEPGRARVVVVIPGAADPSKTVELAAGASTRVVFDLSPLREPAAPPPPPAPAGPPAAAWIAAGVGVAGVAVFAIFGSMASSANSDLLACSPACGAERRDEADAGRRDQVIANVGLGVGAAAMATAALIWILAPAPAGPRAGRSWRRQESGGLRVAF